MVEFDLTELFEAAHQMQANWEREGLQFCFIGGLAVHHWGEIRMTQDVDATVLTGFGNESVVIEKLWTSLDPRIADATQFAKLNRVVLGPSKTRCHLTSHCPVFRTKSRSFRDQGRGFTPMVFRYGSANRATWWF